MSSSVGTIQLDLGVNYDNFNRQIGGIASNAQSTVMGAFSGLGGLIAGAFAVKELIDFGRESINLASNLTEVQNVVDTTFREMSTEINNFAKTALDKFGLSELSAKKFASTMGAMMKTSGIRGGKLVEMSEALTGLSGDISSFYNLSQQDAFDKLMAGMSGETEPLKRLGINMSVANMEAYALSQGIRKSWLAMSQAEQTMLRYNYIMSVTKDVQGDFAKTSNSWANQTRLLSEQWKIFMGTMGAGFINILTPVVRGLNVLIQHLQVAAEYFKAFTALLFGAQKPASSVASSSTDFANAVTDSSSSAVSSLSDIGSAATDTGKSIQDAAKKAEGSLSSFDQLNVIGQKASDSLGGVGGVGGSGGAGLPTGAGPIDMGEAGDASDIDASIYKPLLDVLTSVKNMASEAWTFLKNAFGPPLSLAISEVIPVLEEWKTSLSETFDELLKLGEPLKNWFLNDLKPLLQEVILAGGYLLAGLLDSGLKVFNSFRDAILPIFKSIAEDGLPLITDVLSGALHVFMAFFDTAKYVFDTLWTGVIDPFLQLFSKMFVDTIGVLKDFWDEFGDDIVGGLVDAFQSIKELFNSFWTSFLEPIVNTIVTTMTDLWNNHLKGLVEQFTIFVGKVVDGALEIFNEFIAPLAKWLIETLGPVFAETFNDIIEVVGDLVGFVIDDVANMLEAFGGLIDFVVGVFTGDWQKAWDGIKTIFSSIWDGIKATVAVFDWLLPFDNIAKAFGEIKDDMVNKAKETWNAIKAPFDNSWFSDKWKAIKDAFYGIKKSMQDTASSIWSVIKSPFNNSWFADKWKGIKNAFSNIKQSMSNAAKQIWSVLKSPFNNSWFSNKWSGISSSFGNIKKSMNERAKQIWSTIKSPFNNSWFSSKWSSIVSSFSNMKKSISNKAKEIWNSLKSPFTSAYSWFNNNVVGKIVKAFNRIKSVFTDSFASGIKNIFNKFIDMLNTPMKMLKGISVAGYKPFSGVPLIPKLARGGIVDQPTLAMVGEAGKEAVMPLENNTGWITDLAGKIATILALSGQGSQGTASNTSLEIVLQIGDSEFGRIVIDSINKLQRQAGKTLIKV